ncbi:MAG: hypothetical protein JWN24_625 [Phycisphaerales bacterium]|nr:hypothetical protein [Phycisphaerales bacterium]
MTDLICKDKVYAIVGAAMEVHRELGCGFLEAVYQEAMKMELTDRGLPFKSQELLRLMYKKRPMKKKYLADFVCFGKVIVEIKAMETLSGTEEAQILNYLKATGFRVGIVINFGCNGKLEWNRYVN